MANNYYKSMRKKTEFFSTNKGEEDQTDQTQKINGNIREMAKKFGIDAILSKAEQINASEYLKGELYGFDYTQGFTAPEQLLNTSKKLKTLFENVPARVRKNVFNDNIENFISVMTGKDEDKLTELNNIGLISDTQLQQVKQYNQREKITLQENQKRKEFTEFMNRNYEGLYDNYRQNGTIDFGSTKNNSTSGGDVQTGLQ